ncbi:fimbrillin family protein [Bacteroides faecium]|uniref:Fimbrillin family protein n=1 Tax=Bacteroides faecium TaxID=2715212 RepID=A0A6H0KIR6_9BACE|nr:fimbrillin family protein [Bacteroides faecium]QIU93260.1 fimbrillin family protein [Bacteroides faecium]
MKKLVILSVGMLLTLAACNNDESGTAQSSNDGTALFTASIDGQRVTRASNAKWDNNDRIGISGTCGTKPYTNVCYKTSNGSGNDFEFEAGDKIYYQDMNEVNFTAYYPWKEALTASTTIAFSTDEQANQKDFDFLWAQGKGSKNSPKVDFGFTHQMSKIAITVKAGNDITCEEVKAAVCYLKNHQHQGTFDREAGTATTTGNQSAEWAFANNTANQSYNTPDIATDDNKNSVTYGLILTPQTFTPESLLTFTAKVTTGEATDPQNFSAAIELNQIPENNNANELKPGIQYNITINVNKTGLSIGDCSISKWTEYSYETDADMQ